jgi:hypothetical protein
MAGYVVPSGTTFRPVKEEATRFKGASGGMADNGHATLTQGVDDFGRINSFVYAFRVVRYGAAAVRQCGTSVP